MSKQSPDSSSDQSSYSVDEMMARLREGEREKRERDEGELVTRPDGTQVVRVRRRKRRSKQPVVEARKRKTRSLKFLIPLVVGVLVLLGVGVIMLVAKYNSRGYQEEFESGLVGVMGSKVSIERLVVTPVKVRATSFQSEWPAGGMLETLELKGIEADLSWSGFIGGTWSGSTIAASNGVLKLGPGSRGVTSARSSAAEGPMDYEQVRCRLLDVRFGDEKKAEALLEGTEATLRTLDNGPTQVHFRGGNLILGGWDPLKVDLGLGQMTGAGFEIVSFRAKPADSASPTTEMNLTTAATVHPGRPVELNLKVTDYPLSHLLGKAFGELFSGTVSSEAGSIIFGNDGLPQADVRTDVRVEFSGESAGMAGFPFLENLRTVFGESRYVRPEFGSVKGVFRRSAGGAELQGLVLESRDQMIVRGSLELSATDELSGTLEVGIPESEALTATGKKRNAVFGDPVGGYCWVRLMISGDAANPDDNFKKLLQAAAREAYERRDARPSVNRFDELTQPR